MEVGSFDCICAQTALLHNTFTRIYYQLDRGTSYHNGKTMCCIHHINLYQTHLYCDCHWPIYLQLRLVCVLYTIEITVVISPIR